MIMGGEHYSYFKILPADAKDLTGRFQLWMIAVGGPVFDLNYWISSLPSKGASDPTYGSLDVRKPVIQIVHEGGHAWDRALPVGEYLIEFDAKNGHWNEILKIFVEDGQLKQSIKVVGFNGKPLRDSTD